VSCARPGPLTFSEPNESRLLDLADPAIDKTQFTREALDHLMKIQSLATEAKADSRVSRGLWETFQVPDTEL
jgi:hypothetical protein